LTMVNVDDELYKDIQEVMKIYKVDYPTLKGFVDRAILDKLNIIWSIKFEKAKANKHFKNKSMNAVFFGSVADKVLKSK